jgi:hypothetical protein
MGEIESPVGERIDRKSGGDLAGDEHVGSFVSKKSVKV